MRPGDRLFLMSDGITECPGADGEELGEDGSGHSCCAAMPRLASPALLEALVWDLQAYAGGSGFSRRRVGR